MKTIIKHLDHLRHRVLRGLMRVLFTETAIGRGETVNSMRPPDHQSPPAGDPSADAAEAGQAQAGRTRTNVSRPGQG
jgi:hypothetical protein